MTAQADKCLRTAGCTSAETYKYFHVNKRVYLNDKSSLLSLSNACAPCNQLILSGPLDSGTLPLSAGQSPGKGPLQMVASVVLVVTGMLCMDFGCCSY